MNYEEKSNFEINKAVSSLVDFGDLVVTVNDGNEVVYLCDKDGFFDMVPISHFDPCNNPSDAWPIIYENKLSITTWGSRNDFWKVTDAPVWDCENPNAIHVADKNPLRAAMVCFLKMKDAENGKH